MVFLNMSINVSPDSKSDAGEIVKQYMDTAISMA